MRRREEPMEERNRVNEEQYKDTQRQETEMITGKEKAGTDKKKIPV